MPIVMFVISLVIFPSLCWAGRASFEKTTGRFLEYQSRATPGTLITNALRQGYSLEKIEERELSDEEWVLVKKQWIDDPAQFEREQSEQPVEIPLSDFGGIVGGLAGAASLVLVARKKKGS